MNLYFFDKEKLLYKRVNKIYLFFFACFFIGLLFGFFYESKENINIIYENTIVALNKNDKDNSISEEILYSKIIEYNISFPDIVFAQAIIESGRFNSKIFLVNNNLFGMKQPRSRPTTCIGQEFGHAKYNKWEDSLIDYAIYQAKYLSKFKTESEYLLYIENNYAEDPDYLKKIKSILLKIKK